MGEILFPTIDPVILQLGPLQIRWYSMMYVVGFVVGHFILVRLARARFFPLREEKVPDLIFWLVIGVMGGGRIGYCLFYRPELFLSWHAIAVWEGGLSFHGGLLGVLIAAYLFSRSNQVSAWRVVDSLALAITPGIFAVRIANFINGELYGRITDDSVPWAMRFPTDPVALARMGVPPGAGIREREEIVRHAFDSGLWDQVRQYVPLRHPSEIYEALVEGLLTGLVMWLVYRRTRKNPLGSGVYGGVFALCYGIGRFCLEWYRQPDEQFRGPNDPIGTVFLGMTMGQLLCAAMILYGLLAITLRWRYREGLRVEPDGAGLHAKEEPA